MATTLEDLIAEQDETAGPIERFLINLRKLETNNITLSVLETRQELLQAYWKSFTEGHRHVLRTPDAKNSDYISNDRFADIEEVFLQHSAVLKDMIRKLSPAIEADPRGVSTSTSVEHADDSTLPKIPLPSFSGDISEWESFRDRFRSLIHGSTRLSKVRKLEYLKSSLTGEAATMLERTPITDANYDGAWTSLQKRFENKRVLSAAHMRRLVNCVPVTKGRPEEIKRLLDDFRQAIDSFAALDRPVKEWDEWFVFLFAEKLDPTSRLAWEVTLKDRKVSPTFASLEDFFEDRAHALYAAHNQESTASAKRRDAVKGTKLSFDRSRTALPVKADAPPKRGKRNRQCPLCQGNHNLNYCPKFKGMSAGDRKAQAIKVGVCLSCLNVGHVVAACPSAFRCLVCESKHHTLLHDAYVTSEFKTEDSTGVPPESSSKALVNSICAKRLVLLATARVRLWAPNGKYISVRAVLDQGADASFVSEWVAQTLRLKRRATHVTLAGSQGRDVGIAKHEVQLVVTADFDSSFRHSFHALVTREVIPPTPSRLASVSDWPHLRNLHLADAEFHKPSQVDILFGADVCSSLFGETRQGPTGTPAATHTPFGWVIFGPVPQAADATVSTSRRVFHTSIQDPLSCKLQRFWELEEILEPSPVSPEEVWCGDNFVETHRRDETGRYIVRLPFRRDCSAILGSSKPAAMRTLLSNERRQQKDPPLRSSYVNFMEEYQRLGHMESVPEGLSASLPVYYLPHHAVWKGDGENAKIRVVFNASCITSSEISLNDLLTPGPKLQTTLWSVLTKWRLFQFAFSTDIVKMFRQILVHPADRDWQRILWRTDPSHLLDTYRLTTVTYGTAPAPYLALRVLRQLALDEGKRFPLGAQVLLQHSYVDDLLAGGHDLEGTRAIQQQLINILKAGGFQLSKWATSHPSLDPQVSEGSKLFQEPDTHGALGLAWTPTSDTLSIKGPVLLPVQLDFCWTKRKVLSELARLFDPMGWLAPVLVKGKILMQDLWLCGVGWDDPIPPAVDNSWRSFRESLHELGDIRVARWISYVPNQAQIEFHGFCDASERAYCATVFLRVQNLSQRQTSSSLLVARTKVAPVKVISVPRLELCGAILLARLLTQTQRELALRGARTFVWTDSSVVMAWTRSHASRWQPFVAHRVAEIQRLLPNIPWRHVRSLDNPADLATRGMDTSSFKALALWWQGPTWLIRCTSEWPDSKLDLKLVEAPELRSTVTVNAVQERQENELLARFPTFPRLCRIMALVRRFVFNLRNSGQMRKGFLTSIELSETRNLLCRLSQLETFSIEVDDLSKGRPIKLASSLASLRVFLDEQGLIRVGGRLRLAALPSDYKNPIVISRHSSLARSLVTDAHLATLHDPQGTCLNQGDHQELPTVSTNQRYITGVPSRLQPSRPFLKSGVDYAGPLMLRTTKGRGHKAYKGYVAVFVCLCTKAVHLEVVSDLTSTTFVAAFRRFVSRHGHCAEMLSDNATTFRGADGELRSLFRAASTFYNEVAETLAMDGTKWSFIPPYSPHFGGLWEAAVKSAKYHLRRVVGDHTLTFEELTTLMCQIETCLNSRPITSLTDDPSDLSSLTPGHFLVGEPLFSIPEPNQADLSVHGLARWKLVSNLRDHFWRRWTQEYLHQLQQLPKWRRRQCNWKVGTLVLVKDDLQPPKKWALGRLLEVHPGKDGLVRVVKVRTATRTTTRSIGTLCPLPDWKTDVPPDGGPTTSMSDAP